MTDDDKALVAKIRSEAELQKHYDGLLHMQMTLWADRIEALSAENERIKDRLGWICATMDLDDDVSMQWVYAELEVLRGLGETE